MPNRDGTGPRGVGQMTGRSGGRCIVPVNTAEEELAYLKNRCAALKEEWSEIEGRIRQLESAREKKQES